jgi:succinoglycan biosynthesis protein ExoO
VLDADDAWRPERLERLLIAADGTGADFVADDLILYDDALGSETGVAFDFGAPVMRLDAEALFGHEAPLRLGLLKPLLRRRFLVESGLRYEESLRSAEDFLLYAELLFRGGTALVLQEPGYIYTARVGAQSRQRSTGSRSTTSLPSLFWIADTLAERYGERFTPGIAAGLERFRGQTERRWIASEITRLRQSRSFGALVAFLMRHPKGAWRYLVTSRSFNAILGHHPAE